jgi:hypothetical protein
MIFYIIVFLGVIPFISSYRVFFSPGSRIPYHYYQPFLNKLESSIKQPILPYNDTNNKEECIVIGHSFGGSIAICDYLLGLQKNNISTSNITGIILINSHFNQRTKMPYIPLNAHHVNIPTLTILNNNDERLPLHASVDDFLVSYQENITDKYYIINNGTHFSSFENELQMNLVINQVANFIHQIRKKHFYRSSYIQNYTIYRHSWFFQDRPLYNTIIRPNFLRFLVSKPIPNNSLYLNHKYNLLKSNKINITQMLDNYYDLYIKYNITNLRDTHYKDVTNVTDTIQKVFPSFVKGVNIWTFLLLIEFTAKMAINEFFYKTQIPGFLLYWFTYEPRISIKDSKLTCEVLSIPIKDNIVYYKFPSKHKLLEFLSQEELL